ncbi:MAG TPA: IS21 family transposase [Polyangiaceae bacterium]|nr:IS21 family transposase [Polyangiaceae bacterium]
MRRLRGLGWGTKRIAAELGCSRNTVKRWLALEGWQPYGRPRRQRALDGLEAWLEERFHRHAGNADVVHQELVAEHGVTVSLRTVERAVAPFRRDLAARARATVRFETPPGRQLQIDFGERRVSIAGESVRVHLFVATLGFSRRRYVRAFRHERQSCWLEGIEGAFAHFGGVPEEVLLDNPRALVVHHDAATREVRFHARLLAFASYWGFRPRACAPYRARTKGKDERSVGFVKRNAIAGRSFASWEAFEAHLARWTREVADVRIHGTTGEAPLVRFQREEAQALRPLDGKPPFEQTRELVRQVGADCAIEVDTNAYSVPWRLIGESVVVQLARGELRVLHAGREIALHAECRGLRHQRVVDPAHFEGVAGFRTPVRREVLGSEPIAPSLLRPLVEYEQLAGGSW